MSIQAPSRPSQSTPKQPDPRSGRRGRLRYRLRVATQNPTAAVGILAAALFTYIIVAPIITMLSDGIRVQFGDEAVAGGDFADFTSYYIERVFASPVSSTLFWHPLLNTLMVAVGAVVIALAVGGVLGWFLSRTDMWGKKFFGTALIVPYMLPSWSFALAWMTVFRNRTVGGQQGWLEAIGIEPPNWLAYGQIPITLVLALHYTPFVVLLFGNALKRLDSQLEDSARVLGAGSRVVAMRIILPLMRPSLMSATVLIAAKCLGDFGVAYLLGSPVRFQVLATSLFQAITSRQTGTAAVLAGAIVLIGLITLLVDSYMAREAKRFITVGGKGSMNRMVTLGRAKFFAPLVAMIVFTTSVLIPLAVLTLSTVMDRPADFSPSNFTLKYWIGSDLDTVALGSGILLAPDMWRAAWNTIWVVGLASLTAGILGLLVGYVVSRSPLRSVGTYLRLVTFMPYLVPGIAFAVAFLSLFAVPRGIIPALYGTPFILLIALIADQMPYASRSGISAMGQLGREPEEAAQAAGARWTTRLVRVVGPIQKNSFVSGALLPFISGVKGLSLVVVLAVPGSDLLTTYSLRLVEFGYDQAGNAVVLIICAIAFFGTLLGQKLSKSSLSEGM